MKYLYLFILLIWFPWIWRYHLHPFTHRKRILATLENHPQKKRYLNTLTLLNKLFARVNAKRISLHDRYRLHLQEESFVYGEIDILSFILLLEEANPQTGEVFCDLGSGSGKAILTAALAFDFASTVGIERLPGLCLLAQTKISEISNTLEALHSEEGKDALKRVGSISILNQDFFDTDLSQYDVLFINATCLSQMLWSNLLNQLLQMKPGSRIIVTSHTIAYNEFECIYQGRVLMSWGMNRVAIYKKN
jgi:precorrin-6B methylase 2